MNKSMEKQNMGWGILLISLGISSMLELYTNVPDWIKLSVFFIGGLIGLSIYLTDRTDWSLLIAPYIMLATSVIGWVAIFEIFNGDIIGAVVLSIIAAPFFVVYFANKDNWWALIPSSILFAIALMLVLTSMNLLGGELFAPAILYSIAVPFLVLYFKNKEYWWALIPAYTMVIVGTMVALIEFGLLKEMIIPAYILISIALPFFVVYFRDKNNWWALIPAGILSVIGTGFLLSSSVGQIITPLVLIALGVYILTRKKT